MSAKTAKVSSVRQAQYLVRETIDETARNAEPPGRWIGSGAARLGLERRVTRTQLEHILRGQHPQTGEKLGNAYSNRSIRAIELIIGCPKSISLLHGIADDATRATIERSLNRTVDEMVGFAESMALSVIGRDADRRREPVQGLTAASFVHFTSRALDPHLHAHVVLANRVQTLDQRWRALDPEWLCLDQPTLFAMTDALLRSEFTATLGIRWRSLPSGNCESADVADGVLAAFSRRTQRLRAVTQELVDEHVERTGFLPDGRTQQTLLGLASKTSRPPKRTHDVAERRAAWRWQVARLGLDPDELLQTAMHRGQPPQPSRTFDRQTIVDDALASVSQSPAWRVMELHRAVARAVPTTTSLDAYRLLREIDDAAKVALSRCVELTPVPKGCELRSDGRPVGERVTKRLVTLPSQLRLEDDMLAWATRRLEHRRSLRVVAPSWQGATLSPLERDASSAIAGFDDLVLVRAGAGRNTTQLVGAAVARMRLDNRTVELVAHRAAEAAALGHEVGVEALSVDQLLDRHREDSGSATWLQPDTTLVVTGADLVEFAAMSRLTRLADTHGWRVVMLGLPDDLRRWNSDCVFDLLIDTCGGIDVSPTRPFRAEWEQEAIIQLRRGDPRAVALYEEHDTIRGGTDNEMFSVAADRWWSNRRQYKRTHLLCVDETDVRRFNRRCQELRHAAGDLGSASVRIQSDRARAYIGDEIVTRYTSTLLHTDAYRAVRRGQVWRLDDVGADASLTVSNSSNGTVVLPRDYVALHVDLAYARLTTDVRTKSAERAVLFLPGITDLPNLYSGMTRAATETVAFVAVGNGERGVDVFRRSLDIGRIHRPALVMQAELAAAGHHRPGAAAPVRLRADVDRQMDRARGLADAAQLVELAPWRYDAVAGRTTRVETELGKHLPRAKELEHRDESDLSRRQRRTRQSMMTADEYELAALRPKIDRLREELRQLRSEPERIDQEVVDAQAVLDRLSPVTWETADLDRRIEDDRQVRLRVIIARTPAWLIDEVGERPRDAVGRAFWDEAAGHLAQHRAAYGDPSDGWQLRPDDHSNRADGYRRIRELVDNVHELDRSRSRSRDIGLSL